MTGSIPGYFDRATGILYKTRKKVGLNKIQGAVYLHMLDVKKPVKLDVPGKRWLVFDYDVWGYNGYPIPDHLWESATAHHLLRQL